jgi:Tfp pilus assembly protein PilF
VNRRVLLVAVALAALTAAVLWPVIGAEFINYDDDLYVTENPALAAGVSARGLAWAFKSFGYTGNWHPLAWVSHLLDIQLFGLDPRGHHATSLLIHTASTALLFFVLHALTGALLPSAFVAALFGTHPAHVESVAWVSERKDVLAAFFWFAATGLYVRFVRRPGGGRFLLVLAAFALGLMAKPMVVTLPFTLLLLDWWPLRRFPALGWSRLLLEKAPLLALSAVSSVITYEAQAAGGSMTLAQASSWTLRAANALVSYGRYLGTLAWPTRLCVYYPFPEGGIPAWQIAAAGVLLTAVTLAALRWRNSRPYVAVGWFWFLGTLVPVIGVVQIGWQAMADRYLYLPAVGVFLAVAWAGRDLAAAGLPRRAVVVAAALVLAGCGTLSFRQAGLWHDSATLFRHALAVTTGNWMAHFNYGHALLKQGDTEGAIAQFREELRLNPRDAEAHSNIGTALERRGDLDGAAAAYRAALALDPGFAVAHNNLGGILFRQHRLLESLAAFSEAVRLRPDYAAARFNLATVLDNLGRTDEAIRRYAETLDLWPDHREARRLLDRALARRAATRR